MYISNLNKIQANSILDRFCPFVQDWVISLSDSFVNRPLR